MWGQSLTGYCSKSPKIKGVIIVDEDNDFDEPKDMVQVRASQARVIMTARESNFPIFLTSWCNGRAGETDMYEKPSDYCSDKNGLRKVIPCGTYIYYKNEGDAFSNELFAKALEKSGAESVIIMGQRVNACCGSTAVSAFLRKYQVITLPDVVRGGSAIKSDIGWEYKAVLMMVKHFVFYVYWKA